MEISTTERARSLRNAVEYGKTNGKRNLIVDIDLLDLILRGEIPVGGNELPPEEVTKRLYQVKRERDLLIAAIQKIARWCDGEDQPGLIVHEVDRICAEVRFKVLFPNGHDWCANAMCEICDKRRCSESAQEQSYRDLAASGGIVDAP